MPRPPLLFTLARQRDGKVQLAPHVLDEFGGFFVGGFVMNSVDDGPSFRHEAIVRLIRISGMNLRRKLSCRAGQ